MNAHAHSVRRSSPRTAKRPRTGPDWTDLGLDRSPGPTLVLSGPVLVLKVLWDVKDQSWPLINRGNKLANLSITQQLNGFRADSFTKGEKKSGGDTNL